MSTLLQISDTHFGTERPEVVEALLALVAEQPPTLTVLSGDVTQRATPSEFAAARRFTDRLGPAPLLVVPGNHDIPLFDLWERFRTPYKDYCHAFGPELEPSYESDDWLVLALNTTRWWRHENGQVSHRQAERVAARLEAARPGQLRVVVTHQPVAVTLPKDGHTLLRGQAPAVQRWAQAGVDIILGGHIHLPFVLPLHRQRPQLPNAVWAVNAGTAVSSRLRRKAGNSVNYIHRSPDRPRCARLERWDYVDAQRRFTCVDRTDLNHDAAV